MIRQPRYQRGNHRGHRPDDPSLVDDRQAAIREYKRAYFAAAQDRAIANSAGTDRPKDPPEALRLFYDWQTAVRAHQHSTAVVLLNRLRVLATSPRMSLVAGKYGDDSS